MMVDKEIQLHPRERADSISLHNRHPRFSTACPWPDLFVNHHTRGSFSNPCNFLNTSINPLPTLFLCTTPIVILASFSLAIEILSIYNYICLSLDTFVNCMSHGYF